jgi:hypothetical protein
MITNKDKKYILDLVKKITPDILKQIGFDSTIKEPGHSFHGQFEDELVKRLIDADSNFSEPTETRSSDDIKYKGNYINIKFGFDKNGNPNICSMNRLYNYFLKGIIDSYYILSVDANGPEYHLFNVYDYLDYTNFNYGTGQLMLKESDFKEVYIFNDDTVKLTKAETIVKMADIMDEAYHRHLAKKDKDHKLIMESSNAYR